MLSWSMLCQAARVVRNLHTMLSNATIQFQWRFKPAFSEWHGFMNLRKTDFPATCTCTSTCHAGYAPVHTVSPLHSQSGVFSCGSCCNNLAVTWCCYCCAHAGLEQINGSSWWLASLSCCQLEAVIVVGLWMLIIVLIFHNVDGCTLYSWIGELFLVCCAWEEQDLWMHFCCEIFVMPDLLFSCPLPTLSSHMHSQFFFLLSQVGVWSSWKWEGKVGNELYGMECMISVKNYLTHIRKTLIAWALDGWNIAQFCLSAR